MAAAYRSAPLALAPASSQVAAAVAIAVAVAAATAVAAAAAAPVKDDPEDLVDEVIASTLEGIK